MDKKEILDLFYKQMEGFLADNGFKFNKSISTATKKTKTGSYSMFFDINDMVYEYSITTRLRARNNNIQSIRGEVNPRRNRKGASTILETVSSVLERYNRLDLEYEIQNPGNLVNEKTLTPYIEAFKRFMNEIGLNFFTRFKDVKDFDDWFNSPVLEGTYDFNRGSSLNSSVNGIIAAKLSANPRYEEIYSKWVAGISPKAKETLKELAETKKYLDYKL